MATLLYFGLTNARKGEQSPGEEYCDVVHVQLDRNDKGITHMRLPSLRRRLALLLLCAVAPYVKDRIDAGGWGSFFAAFQPQLTARQRAELFRRRLAEQQRRREGGEGPGTGTGGGESIVKRWLPWLKKAVLGLSLVQRAQLGRFYMSGEFLSIPFRLMGIRFANTKEAETKRPAYYPLGVFVFIGLAIEVLPKVYEAAVMLLRTWGVVWTKPEEDGEEDAGRKGAVATNAGGKRVAGPEEFKCGICLAEPIDDPAVPKCGHAFCYDCILALVHTKPECPVCRQEARPKDIQCIYFKLD